MTRNHDGCTIDLHPWWLWRRRLYGCGVLVVGLWVVDPDQSLAEVQKVQGLAMTLLRREPV